MTSRGIVKPNESGQYELSEDDRDVERANKEIESVRKTMSQLADQLANIEKGIAVKRKRVEENDKQVVFDLQQNEMHVIPTNNEKKTNPSATVYSSPAPPTSNRKVNVRSPPYVGG